METKKKFYVDLNGNGALFFDVVRLENSEDSFPPQYLKVDSTCFGNACPVVMIPLLSHEQIDGMIQLLKDAKTKMSETDSYETEVVWEK